MKFGEVGRTIRLGIIGFGWRGYGQTETLLEMPDVEICAVCDVYPDRVELGKEMVHPHPHRHRCHELRQGRGH